jgi:hypothetical protein
MNKPKKMITFDNCLECPLIANCKEWKALTAKQRATIMMSADVDVGILKTCKLDDYKTG